MGNGGAEEVMVSQDLIIGPCQGEIEIVDSTTSMEAFPFDN
jgi:hypothetical protein